MSDILIKGMEMPKDAPIIIKICSDGSVSRVHEGVVATAVPVPPHGRLIDADALREEVKKHAAPCDAWVFSLIRTAPTIIPAEEAAA